MEMLNKVELQGIVGYVRTQEYTEGKVCARLSLATERAHQDREGCAVIEISWHNVSAWQPEIKGLDLTAIRKGDKLRVVGRIHYDKFTDAQGNDKPLASIVASEITRMEE